MQDGTKITTNSDSNYDLHDAPDADLLHDHQYKRHYRLHCDLNHDLRYDLSYVLMMTLVETRIMNLLTACGCGHRPE